MSFYDQPDYTLSHASQDEAEAIVGLMIDNMCNGDRGARLQNARAIEDEAIRAGLQGADLSSLWAQAVVKRLVGQDIETTTCMSNPSGGELSAEEEDCIAELIEEARHVERERRQRELGTMRYDKFMRILLRIAGVQVRAGHGSHKVVRYGERQTSIAPHRGEDVSGNRQAVILARLGIDHELFWGA